MSFFKAISTLFIPKKLEISGNWKGYYKYSEQYSETIKNKIVDFTANIESKKDGTFIGTIKESNIGVPELSEINGKLKGRKILLIKTYKKSYQLDEEGKRHIEEGPQLIIYGGIFNVKEKRFFGEWRIETIYELIDGKTYKQVTTGDWSMTKTMPANHLDGSVRFL